MWTAITSIVGNVFGIGKDYLDNKRAEKQEIHTQKMTRIKQDGNWENIHASNSKDSWKDEFWTIVFAIPLVLCFIPETVEYVNLGFAALDNTPEWYRYCLITLVGASVGIRNITKLAKKGK